MSKRNLVVEINSAALWRLRHELGLQRLWHFVVYSKDAGRMRAMIDFSKGAIFIYTGHARNDHSSLTDIHRALTTSLLHELRHAWQLEQWGVEALNRDAEVPYQHRRSESDARTWSEQATSRYLDLVKLSIGRAPHPPRALP